MATLIDVSTLGWGVVQDSQGNAASGQAYTLTNTATGVVTTGATSTKGEIVQTLPEGTYTLTVAGITKTVHVAAGRSDRQFVNLRDFGALGTGDNIDAALTAAKAALGANTGTIFIPAGTYVSTAPPSFDSTNGITLKGAGGMSAGAATSTQITFTGSGAGSWLSARSSQGFALEDLMLLYSNAGFTGTFINLDMVTGTPTQFIKIERCYIGGAGVRGAAKLVSLANADIGVFRDCQFSNATVGVSGRGAGGDFSNAMAFYGCTFVNHTLVHCRDPVNAWSFTGCCFENLVTAGGAAAGGAAMLCNFDATGLAYMGCWFGDANTTGTWISFRGGGLFMGGNFIGAASVGIAISAASSGVTIVGNQFDTQTTNAVGITNFAHKDFLIAANAFTGIAVPISMGATPASSWIQDPTNGRLVGYGTTPILAVSAVADANFAAAPPDGTSAYASTSQKHAVRVGGVWKHSAAYT